MKFEKISDSQIRCTLDKKDLSDREIKLSEFAYGSEKARELFGELMNKAYYELGFETGDTPLMIEAVPLSKDSIVLIVTKVESPDELDTRFSNFSPYTAAEDEELDEELEDGLLYEYVKKYADMEAQIKEDKRRLAAESDMAVADNMTSVYSFGSIDEAAQFAHALGNSFKGQSGLYKSNKNGRYYLFLIMSGNSAAECNHVFNLVSEFAVPENSSEAACLYYEEHFEPVSRKNAIAVLNKYY